MPEITDSFLRDQLLARRQKLKSTAETVGLKSGIAELLGEVDAALARMETGTYGLCENAMNPLRKTASSLTPWSGYVLTI